MNKLPNLVIGGCHKAGTTSIFNYLKDHPEISFGDKKEIHYFTPLRYGERKVELSYYESFFKASSQKTKYLLEASPSYLYGKEKIVSDMFDVLDNPKMIFILRNPTKRFVSYVKKRISEGTLSDNLDLLEFVNESYKLSLEKDIDLPVNRAFREGCYDKYLEYWESNSDRVITLHFENLVSHPRSLLTDLSRDININPMFYETYDFEVSNKFHPIGNVSLHKQVLKINKFLDSFLLKNKKIKNVLNKIYFSLNTRKKEYAFKNYHAAIKQLDHLYENENKNLRKRLSSFNNIGPIPDWVPKL